MTDEFVILSPAQWRPYITGMACLFGDDAMVRLGHVTELGEAVVACDDGHRWVLAAPIAQTHAGGRGGICEELGVYDALLAAVGPAGGPFVEYGIVEHRLAAAEPALYADLVGRYGHTALGPRRYTVSSLLGGALGRLSAEGAVAYADGPATGRWSYLGRVSHWATPPADPAGPQVSWADHAAAAGIDPADWPATAGLTGPD